MMVLYLVRTWCHIFLNCIEKEEFPKFQKCIYLLISCFVSLLRMDYSSSLFPVLPKPALHLENWGAPFYPPLPQLLAHWRGPIAVLLSLVLGFDWPRSCTCITKQQRLYHHVARIWPMRTQDQNEQPIGVEGGCWSMQHGAACFLQFASTNGKAER